jgi:hypothetical protein
VLIAGREVQATVPVGARIGHIEITTTGGSFTTRNTFKVTP